jgi:hypothetical protein
VLEGAADFPLVVRPVIPADRWGSHRQPSLSIQSTPTSNRHSQFQEFVNRKDRSMPWFNNFISDSVFYLMVTVVGWTYIFKALNKSAPDVTSAAKKAASAKALSVISKLFR